MASSEGDRWTRRYGPWAVVTGASDGIGRAVAEALAARGVHLVLVARRGDRLEALAARLRQTAGVSTRVVAADLALEDEVRRVVAEVADLDVGLLVASAGFGTSGPLLDADLDRELQMLDVNCRAVVQMVVLLGRRLVARGRGGIVLLSSLVAFQGVARLAHYAATKAYVQSLAEGLRGELAARGVDVLAAAPGPVLSGFAGVSGMRFSDGDRPEVVALQVVEALGRSGSVRPGPRSKLLIGALGTLPRFLRVRLVSRIMRGMTTGAET